jgi:hypothetical protein
MDDKDLFIEWERLLKNVSDFNEHSSAYFHNAPYALKKCKDLLDFMKKEAPGLRDWCNKFLEENRDELYVRFWLDCGWNHLNKHNKGTGNLRFPPRSSDLHPEFLANWERIRSLMGVTEQNDFQFALTQLMEAHRIHDFHFCSIPEILAIHEGRPCDFNGMYCWHCEDMEERWHRHLLNKLKETNHVFLNKSVKEEYLKKGIEAKLAPFGWKPPSTSGNVRHESIEIGNTDGKTATQIMYSIVKFASWQIKIWELGRKNNYETFCEVWVFLESLESKVLVLESACKQVEELVNQS